MAVKVSCPCGAVYSLKDEWAGQTVRCPKCDATIAVPEKAPVEPYPAQWDPAFHRDKFLLRQKHLAISEKYVVWDEDGNEVVYVERPAHFFRRALAMLGAVVTFFSIMISAVFLFGWIEEKVPGPVPGLAALGFFLGAFLLSVLLTVVVATALDVRRHVTFYRTEDKYEPLLMVHQDHKFVLKTMTYHVVGPDGGVLAVFAKNYFYNIVRKRWYVYRPDGTLWALVLEDSILLSLLRRFLGHMYGALRTNFIICREDSEDVIGEFNRKFTILDRYVLDMSRDQDRFLDRRVAAALGVMLDTGEKR